MSDETKRRQLVDHLTAAHEIASTTGLETTAYLIHVALEEAKRWVDDRSDD